MTPALAGLGGCSGTPDDDVDASEGAASASERSCGADTEDANLRDAAKTHLENARTVKNLMVGLFGIGAAGGDRTIFFAHDLEVASATRHVAGWLRVSPSCRVTAVEPPTASSTKRRRRPATAVPAASAPRTRTSATPRSPR